MVTSVPYRLGEWQHFVVTWEPQADMGVSSGGSEQWQGVLTAYVNGVAVATNGDINTPGTGAIYAPTSIRPSRATRRIWRLVPIMPLQVLGKSSKVILTK